MFNEIHRKLSLYYTAIMAMFFIVLVFCVHESMIWSITNEQEHEVLLYAQEEAVEHAIFFQHNEFFMDEDEDNNNRRLFFYAYDNSGQLFNALNPAEEIKGQVLDKINHWQDGTGKITTLKFDDEYKIMMSALPIMVNGEKVGMIYVGRDVTTYYKGMRKATTIIIVVSIIALIIAAIAGHVMAKKAMVPIKLAYDKQRQFTADASHELRTPLSVIMSSVEVIEQEQTLSKSPFIEQIIMDMKDEIRKMSRLVTDLLTLARSEGQGYKLNKTEFYLGEVIEETIRKLRSLAGEKSIEVRFNNEFDIKVFADLERIKQLILILLDNAIKYTLDGGKITIKASLNRYENNVFIQVIDTGIGISESDQNHIFDRFYRVDKARSRAIGGSGLGLSIAKWIVTMHKGEIKLMSKLGEGTTFTVVLPKR